MLDKAAELMANTKDPSHGVEHINRLMKDSNRFFKSVGHIFEMDKEVLLLALYWHDVWKSQHAPTAANYLFQQLYEGWGSMFMFRKYAQVVGLPSGTTNAVSYAIRKHSAIQFQSAKTLEAQLLWDIDTLDLWNSQRIQTVFNNFKWTTISLFDSYILYLKKVGFHFNFEWTRNEVQKISPFFFKEMARFRESLVHRGKKPPSLFIQSGTASTKYDFNNRA